ncbi:MAG: hypothetical protein JO354_01245 [Verrucomicrobia bacterium]|nr:hypothetical protein [Verrucomicrobiota bacterium]
MTAAQAYDLIMNGGTSDFADAVAILEKHRPWCLIGGLAVNCYVEPVYTLDADIVVIAERLPEAEREFSERGFRIQRFAHSLNAQRGKGKLNLQFATDERYQKFLDNAAPAEVLGLCVPVASLNDLVRGKTWAWQDEQRRLSKRKKDELDLIRIAEAHPEFRSILPPEIVRQLPSE